jgi:hypothetical protein
VEHPAVTAGPNDRVEPMSRMTQIIAQNMVLSRRISPHVHSYFEVDYTRIDQVRARAKRAWAEAGVKVTYTHFIAKAVARALREHPKLNATISGTDVIYRADVNLGIAVAIDNGLIVPVVRGADDLSLVGLARRINDLATRARNRQLKPDEIQGGTFTITNPGIFGTTIGFPIISQPQVAIMGVGGVEMRPAVVTDEFGNHAIVARKRGFISLGYDHRLVNGADGDQFLARVKELMDPKAPFPAPQPGPPFPDRDQVDDVPPRTSATSSRYLLLPKNADAVPAPAASALPRISGILHDPSGPRPAVASASLQHRRGRIYPPVIGPPLFYRSGPLGSVNPGVMRTTCLTA